VRTGGPIIASPRVRADRAILGSADGKLYALSTDDGSVLWSAQIATQITGSAAFDGASAFVGTVDGHVLCVGLDSGDTLWRHRLGSPIVATPSASGSMAIVGPLNGKVYGLRS
jgi:outer membrane protein assembly factor BamB